MLYFFQIVFFICGGGLTVIYFQIDDKEMEKLYEWILPVTSMTLNFIAQLFLCYYGILMRRQKSIEVNMHSELLEITIIWTIFGSAFYFLLFQSKDVKNAHAYIFIILLVRNTLCSLISIFFPAIKSKEENQIAFFETRECVRNVELTMSTELPFMFFSYFVGEADSENGHNIIELYTKIKLYEARADDEEIEQEKFEAATGIMNEFIQKDAHSEVKGIPEEVREMISRKFENLSENLDKHLFDPIYGIIINKLQVLYSAFQKSTTYDNLILELRINEIIYEKLVAAELI